MVREQGAARVTLASEGDETPGPAIAAKTIELRAEVGIEQTVRYSYSLDGKAFLADGRCHPARPLLLVEGIAPGAVHLHPRRTRQGPGLDRCRLVPGTATVGTACVRRRPSGVRGGAQAAQRIIRLAFVEAGEAKAQATLGRRRGCVGGGGREPQLDGGGVAIDPVEHRRIGERSQKASPPSGTSTSTSAPR